MRVSSLSAWGLGLIASPLSQAEAPGQENVLRPQVSASADSQRELLSLSISFVIRSFCKRPYKDDSKVVVPFLKSAYDLVFFFVAIQRAVPRREVGTRAEG